MLQKNAMMEIRFRKMVALNVWWIGTTFVGVEAHRARMYVLSYQTSAGTVFARAVSSVMMGTRALEMDVLWHAW